MYSFGEKPRVARVNKVCSVTYQRLCGRTPAAKDSIPETILEGKMKKGLYVILAVLTVFAMVMVSCDDGSNSADELYTVSFDANGGSGTVAAIKQTAVGEAITLPAGAALTAPDGKTFGGWSTSKSGTAISGTSYTPTKDITLYAVWTGGTGPGPITYPIVLGDFNNINNETQKGWLTNGVDGKDSTLTAEAMTGAKYLVLELSKAPTGGFQIIWQGDGDGWAWDQTDNVLANDGSPDPSKGSAITVKDGVTSLVIELSKAVKNYDKFLESEQIKLFIAYYSNNITDLGVTKAYLSLTAPEGSAGPDLARAEKVTLSNNWIAMYRFELPAGKTIGADYKGISADYMFTPENLATARVRNGRIYGPYEPSDFAIGIGKGDAEGLDFAYANLNNQNATHILDDAGLGNNSTAGALLEALAKVGIVPEGDKWFTFDLYKIDGSRKNGSYTQEKLDAFNASGGVIYLGVSLPAGGNGDPANEYYIRDVTLIGYNAADNVVATSLWFEQGGKEYPAMIGYPTNDGSNGWKEASREKLNSKRTVVTLGAEKVTLSNNWYPMYQFTLPTGKTFADYQGISADYMFTAEDLADARVRNGRVYGDYVDDDFTYGAGTGDVEGINFFVANLNNQNATHILDDAGLGNNSTAGALLEALAKVGIVPEANKWFTFDLYKIDGSRKNGSYTQGKLDALNAKGGTIYMTVGLPSGGATDPANVYSVKNITLIGYEAADNVIATPLYKTEAGVPVPVMLGYPTTDGSNGWDKASRTPMK